MKRSPMPPRKSAMARGGPLPKGKPMDRRTRVNPMSKRRRGERDERQTVREEAMRGAGHACSARAIVPELPCRGPLDVDEVAGRGRYPGGHLDPSNVQVLCRAHHNWKHANPLAARERGLDRPAPPLVKGRPDPETDSPERR